MIKKLLLIFAVLLFAVPACADGIYKPVARGTVTRANMKISAAAGVSFVDFSAADILTGKLGHLLKVRDSAGRAIQGYIRSAGSSETVGSDSARTFVAEAGTPTIAGDQITFSNALEGVIESDYWTNGGLYLVDWTISSYSGSGNFYLYGGGLSSSGITKAANGNYVSYITSNSVNLRVNSAFGCSGVATINSIKQVTAPSATGVTISSTKGGTAMDNWAQKDAAFNYNDASGYTYEIYRVLQAPVIATHNISAYNALMDTTTDNAFAAPVGVDLSPYQDGKHILALYDASGYAAAGWISATAPSGESLTDVLTYATLNLTSGWTVYGATITDADSFVNTKISGLVYKYIMIVGNLYKSSISATVSAGTVMIHGPAFSTIYAINGAGDAYATAVNTSIVLANVSGGVGATTDITAINVASVDMPAATGALLLSSKGGSRGYIYKHASFDPNAALTAKILYVGD